MALCAAVALFTECSGSRFTVRPLTDGGWTLVDPSGHDTFVVALNHLASPTYYDAITGANGLAPCRADDVLCQEADVFNGTYGGNWGAATADLDKKDCRLS